jgi:N-acetylmuramoyl-L-alanine amidase
MNPVQPAPVPPCEVPDSPLVERVRPSPNHGARRAGAVPRFIILHYTGMSDGEGAIAWLCDPRSEVSCHYVVDEAGGVLQLVSEGRRAWHAGRSFWAGETDMNSVSIGIEIVNPGHDGGLPPYPDVQIASVARLCRDIADRWAIPPHHVLAHSDVAPGRKQDPGERFPWDVLHRSGVGLWLPQKLDGKGATYGPGEAGEAVTAFQAGLAAYGYGLEATGIVDAATERVTRSFQLHFRPARVDGRIDPGSRDTLTALLARCAAPG